LKTLISYVANVMILYQLSNPRADDIDVNIVELFFFSIDIAVILYTPCFYHS